LVEANVSEKLVVSIFMAEVFSVAWTACEKFELRSMRMGVFTSALQMETARFSETLASTNQSTRRLNLKELHQKGHKELTHSVIDFFELLIFMQLVTKIPVLIAIALFKDHFLGCMDCM
jgi:hypothetical protein